MKRVIFFTGAGISAESGVPTFRTGKNALWENHRLEDVCHIDSFERNYNLVHQFYNQRRLQLAGVEPNLAHRAIAELQRRYPQQVSLTTSNVDDLHERAGSPQVSHLHGNLLEMVHLDSGRILPIAYEAFDPDSRPGRYKPNIVFFGEAAPAYAGLYDLMYSLSEQDLVVVVGSGENVVAFCAEAYLGSDGPATILYIDPTTDSVYEHSSLRPYNRHYRQPATEALTEGAEARQFIEAWLAT